jgi:hypothetical protein
MTGRHGKKAAFGLGLLAMALVLALPSGALAATIGVVDRTDPADFSAAPGSTGNYINAFSTTKSGGGQQGISSFTVTTTGTANLSSVQIRNADGSTTHGSSASPSGNDWVVSVSINGANDLTVYVDVAGGATPGQTVTAVITDLTTNGTKGTITDVAGTTMTIASACVRAAPTFTMGTDQSITISGSAVYTLSITNNDSTACADSTFDISILSETGITGAFTLPSVLSASQVTVVPQTVNTTVTLTVTGNGTGNNGNSLTSTVEVRDDTDHLGQEQTDAVTTTISAACVRAAPTISLGADKNIGPAGSAVYDVSVTNNDTAACPPTTFNLNIISETGNTGSFTLPSVLSAAQIALNPGQTDSTSVDFTVTGNGTGSDGHTLTSTVQASDTVNHGGQSGSDSVITTITVSCTRAAPTINLGTDQFIIPIGSAVYDVSVKNNDSTFCPPTTFNLNIISETGDTGSFTLPSVLSAAQIALNPGQTDSTSVDFTVTGNGTGVGGHELASTVEARDDTNHPGQTDADTVRTIITVVAGDGYLLKRDREIVCYACHKTDQNRSPSDPDWDEAIKIHNSENLNSSKWSGEGGWGVPGGKYGEFRCVTCHTPHDTTNIYLVRNSVSPPDGGVWNSSGASSNPVVFTALTGMGDDTGGHTSSTRSCEVCHSITKYHRYNTTGQTNLSHNNATDCTECHDHRQAFAGFGTCVDCHNTSRTKTLGSGGTIRKVTGSGGDFVRLSRHVSDGTSTEIVTNHDCAVCHMEASTADASPSGDHNDPDPGGGLVDLRDVDTPTVGWSVDNKAMTEAMRTDVDTFCLTCHDSDGAAGIAVTGPHTAPAFAIPPSASEALSPFNDTDNFRNGRDGLATRTRVVDVKSQFFAGTGGSGTGYNGNPSQHAVLGARYSTTNANWLATNWTSHALRNGTAINSARERARLHCSDCHLSELNAHGAQNAWHMLMDGQVNVYNSDTPMGGLSIETNADINICYKCHNRDVYKGKSVTAGSRFTHSRDSNPFSSAYGFGGDAALLGPPCLNCHAGDGYGRIHGRGSPTDGDALTYNPQNVAWPPTGTTYTKYRFMPGAWLRWQPGSTGTDADWATVSTGTCYFSDTASAWSECTKHQGRNGSPGNGGTATTNYGRPVRY